MNSKKNINYKIEDSFAIITLNRSPSNAFTIQFLDEILNLLTKASKDESVKVVILESNIAKTFCAGLDLNILVDKSSMEIREFLNRLYIDLWDVQYNMGKPYIE